MNNNKNELKCKCGSTIFNIFKKDNCSDCRFNAAYDTTLDKYVYGADVKGLDRTHVEDEGVCEWGDAYGTGCIRSTCAVCGEHKDHIPMMEA